MNPARFRWSLAQRQGDVDGLGCKPRIKRCRFQDLAARGERLAHPVLGEVDRRTLRLALVRRHLAERGQQRGDRALLAQRRDAHELERRLVGRGGDLLKDSLFERCEIGHGDGHLLGADPLSKHDAVIIRESG